MHETYQPPIENTENFPDEKSPEYAGCFMYAFYKLGLDPEEARMGVYPRILDKYLKKVDSSDDADAVAMRHRVHGGFDHMAFIDHSKNGEMKHRGNVGWPIETTSLDKLKENYRPENYEYIFLKKRAQTGFKAALAQSVSQSIEGQEPSWKNALSRKFVGVEGLGENFEEEKVEEPPNWFVDLVVKITDMWFDPKSFESEEMYEKLGIKIFKKYIPTGEIMARLVWKISKENAFIRGSSEADLRRYEKFTRIYESIHLLILPLVAANVGIDLATGSLGGAAFAIGINTLVNVYPVFLQRYNRLRLYGAISKAQERGKQRDLGSQES